MSDLACQASSLLATYFQVLVVMEEKKYQRYVDTFIWKHFLFTLLTATQLFLVLMALCHFSKNVFFTEKSARGAILRENNFCISPTVMDGK